MSAGASSLVLVGALSKVELGPWVTAKGAATFADLGFTLGQATIEEKVEYHEVDVAQRLGIIKRVPKKRTCVVKGELAQGELDNLRSILNKPTGALTGTPPNSTLKSDLSAGAQHWQARLTSPGGGTTGVRTWTFWDVVPVCGAIPFGKDVEQKIPFELHVNEETTGSGTDSWQAVDS